MKKKMQIKSPQFSCIFQGGIIMHQIRPYKIGGGGQGFFKKKNEICEYLFYFIFGIKLTVCNQKYQQQKEV